MDNSVSDEQNKMISDIVSKIIKEKEAEEYSYDLKIMKDFIRSIKVEESWFKHVDSITYSELDKKYFDKLLTKYHKKNFYITFNPSGVSDKVYLIRNLELFDEEEIKIRYEHVDDLVYDSNKRNPYGNSYYHHTEVWADKNHYSTEWLAENMNVKFLNPDLLKVYDYFKHRKIIAK